MIKDKITPELKRSFSESIKKTTDTGKEHGFFICEDKDEKLHASERRCEGSLCNIIASPIIGECPVKVKGFFHVHPQIAAMEIISGRKFTQADKDKIISYSKEFSKRKNIHLQTPSHRDVLTALLQKCQEKTEGVTCIAADMDTDKVECWIPKKRAANFVTCNYAEFDNIITKEIGGYPKMWIKPLFHKEVIHLDE